MNLQISGCDCPIVCGTCVCGSANSGCSGESPDCPNTLAVSFTIPAWTSSETDCGGGVIIDGIEYPEWSGTVTVTRAGTSGNASCRYTGSVTPSISLWLPNCTPPNYGTTCTSRTITVELNRGQLNPLTSWFVNDSCQLTASVVPTSIEISGTYQCLDGSGACNCKGVGVSIIDDMCMSTGSEHGFSIGYNSSEAECGDDVPCYTRYGGSGWGIQNWWGRLITNPTTPSQISSVTIS